MRKQTFKSLTDTKAKRHDFYKKAATEYNKTELMFICSALDSVFFEATRRIPCVTARYFPELLKHKPKGSVLGAAWFDFGDRKRRIKILKACIKETAPKKRK